MFHLDIMASELASAIAACGQVVESSSKIPILKTTRISVSDRVASFMATNTEQTVIARAACEGRGTVCVDTFALDVKIKSLRSNQPVNIEGDDKFINVVQGRTKWKLPVLLDDFPVSVGDPIKVEPVRVGRDFIKAMRQVSGVVMPSHPTPALTGVYVGNDRVMATDARRLRSISVPPVSFDPFIVPIGIVSKIAGLLPDGGNLRADANRFSIDGDQVTVISRLVHGMFPDMDRAMRPILEKLASKITADADVLLAAMRRAGAIRATGEKQSAFLNMQMQFRADEIGLYARNLDGEEGNDFARAERDGEDCDIGVVGNEAIDEIASLECDTVVIAYGDDRTPMKISSAADPNNFRIIQARTFR